MKDDEKLLINIIIIIFGLINFFISFLLFLIHFRQSYFKQRFFNVIYYIIINECLISLIIIVVSFLNIIDVKDVFYIFGVFFYVFFNIIILYNIQILKYLINDPEINTDLIKKDIKSTNLSISFTPYNFRKYHLFSYLLSIVWTISFFLGIYFFEFYEEMKKYLILIDFDNKYLIFIFFFPVLIYAICSFIYLFSIKFCSTSEKIILKMYSIYTISTSIIYLLIPLITYIILEKNEDDDYKSNIITYSLHLLSLLLTNIYRINCIYVNSVLKSNGNDFCNKFIKALRIIFCGDSVKSLNIIDFNNPFIYHSLSTQYDLNINNDQLIESDANISKFAPDL